MRKIVLFMLPALIAAILVHSYSPHIAALPEMFSFIQPVGYLLLFLGLILLGAAVIQLMMGFSHAPVRRHLAGNPAAGRERLCRKSAP